MIQRVIGAVLLVAVYQSLTAAKEMVPFKGQGTGQGFVDVVNPDPDCGSLLTIRSTQQGQATHLGNYTGESIPCFNPLDGSFFGKATTTSANGDELYTTYVGQFQPDPIPDLPGATLVLATVTINGGSGRFENATGSYDYREIISGGGTTFEFTGEISSVGSANSAHAVPEPTSMSLAATCLLGLGTFLRRRAIGCGADNDTAVVTRRQRIQGCRWAPWLIGRAVVNKTIVVTACLLSVPMAGSTKAEFWYEDFTDGNLSDSGIEWTYNRLWEQTYSNSPDGLLATATNACCGAGGWPTWEDARQGWSIRTQGRLSQNHGFFGAGTGLDPKSSDATWNLIAANGSAVMGSGLVEPERVEIETNLRPFDKDVIVQLETLDGVMRMWAWHDGDQPTEDIAPIMEEDFDLFDAFPVFWTRSPDGSSSALFRWIAISTEHMPVNMPLPLSDLIGDFTGNDVLDAADIDTLAIAIQSGNEDLPFDLNQDGIVDLNDHSYWVSDIMQTSIGDANLDGEFNSGDLVQIFQAGKFESDRGAGWSEGDWDGDSRFDSGDLVAAFQDGGFEVGPRTAIAAVPEPSGAILLALGLFGIGCIRKPLCIRRSVKAYS